MLVHRTGVLGQNAWTRTCRVNSHKANLAQRKRSLAGGTGWLHKQDWKGSSVQILQLHIPRSCYFCKAASAASTPEEVEGATLYPLFPPQKNNILIFIDKKLFPRSVRPIMYHWKTEMCRWRQNLIWPTCVIAQMMWWVKISNFLFKSFQNQDLGNLRAKVSPFLKITMDMVT